MQSYGLFPAALIATGTLWVAAPAQAQDASWGCQVLLCAASQNPSWHGVSYCVPPMTKLIAAMAKPGFSWPICHEAKAGTPGREIYEQCPEGTKVGYSERGHDGNRSEPDRCVKMVNVCRHRFTNGFTGNSRDDQITYRNTGGGRDGDSCTQQVSSARPRRADPWYFDIPNEHGQKQRFWFNLNY
ncbi:hypothetical protein [Mesorhizobium sp. M0276]|uniref:hypothetical protein n=1 Tax=Mesorhizobium sp. M0276 TaxID=2956928 RepID=UPI003339CD0A